MRVRKEEILFIDYVRVNIGSVGASASIHSGYSELSNCASLTRRNCSVYISRFHTLVIHPFY